MGTRRQSSSKSSRRLRVTVALAACSLAGPGFAVTAFAQRVPAATTDLGTIVVTPTRPSPAALAPIQTTVQRGALKLRMQPGFPPRLPSPATRGRNHPAAFPARAPPTAQSQPAIRTPPETIHAVAPAYPPAALAQALRGSVTVGFTIEADGRTKDIHIISSQPTKVFDQATLQAVRQWRFEPAMVNGRPVAITARQTIVFNPPLQQRQAPAPPPPPVSVQAASPPPPRPAPARIKVHPVHIVAPKYPPRAYRRRIGGSVTVRFLVGTDGKTHHIRIIEAKPPDIFNRAAKQAVRQWRFRPVATPTPVTQTIRFTPPG